VLDAVGIVGVTNPQNIPSVTQKPRRHVFREGDACVPFDRDVIVIVDPAEIVQVQVGGQGRRFRSPFSIMQPSPQTV
jgi:hypothetical protein